MGAVINKFPTFNRANDLYKRVGCITDLWVSMIEFWRFWGVGGTLF